MSELKRALDVDPCDQPGLREKIDNLFSDFHKEVRDTILELANNFFGPFIVTFATLMAQLLGASVLNLASLIASAVVGGVVGGLIALVNLSLSLVNGSRIMLKYLAVKALKNALESRRAYTKALQEDISGFLNLLRALQTLNIQAENIFFDDLERALPHVKMAARIIGRENSKVTATSPATFSRMGSQPGVNTEQLDIAVEEISKAISSLTGGGTDPLFNDRLSDINEKYGIKVDTDIPGLEFDVPNPLGIVKYFEEAVDQLRQDNSDEVVRRYIVEFLSDPAISNFLRDYASTLFMKARIDSLGKRLPVRSYILTNLGKKGAEKLLDTAGMDGINDGLDSIQDWRDTAKEKINSVFDYLGVTPNKPTVEYPDTGFTTYAANSEAIQSYQAAVLLQDDWMDLIEAESNIVKAFLSPALNKVLGVKTGMEKALSSEDTQITSEAAREKMQWISELAMAKTLVQSTMEPKIGFSSGQRLSGGEIQNKFRNSMLLYDELTDQIVSRVLEEKGPNDFEPKEQDSDKLLNIADQYLSSFFLGPVAMFNPSARQNVISGLQAIRILLNSIDRDDSAEIYLCERFIFSVESNPIFNSVIEPAWEAFMNSLEDVPLLGGLTESMQNGDLARLVNAVSTSKYVVDEIAETADCASKRAAGDNDLEQQAEALSSATGAPKAKTLETLEEARNTITNLKAKRAKIESLEALTGV